MNLYEYMGKEIFRKYGVPVPDSYVVDQASEIKEYRKPVVVKSQILLGGRGKSGGIKFARSADEVKSSVNELLGAKIRGLTVTKVLIEDMINISKTGRKRLLGGNVKGRVHLQISNCRHRHIPQAFRRTR